MIGEQSKSKFLGPANIHGAYADCIRAARKKLTLVMPWFTPSPQLRDDLLSMLERDVQLCLVTRPPWEAKSDQHDANLRDVLDRQRRVERRRILGLVAGEHVDLVEVLLVENVHAKTLIQDETYVVVTSSNLNVMSIGRNTEFGIGTGDPSVIADAIAAVSALRTSDRCASLANGEIQRCTCGAGWLFEAEQTRCDQCPVPPPVPAPRPPILAVAAVTPPPLVARPQSRGAAALAAAHGHGIRCRAEVGRNSEKPYCGKCFGSWNRYKNEDYEERFCHDCGSEETTSKKRPRCRPCWRADAAPAR